MIDGQEIAMPVELSLAALQEAIANTPYKQEDIETPFWPKTDGHLALRDVPPATLKTIEQLAKIAPEKYAAALIQLVLVKRSTGERIYSPEQRSILEDLGSSVTIPLMQKINAFLGFNKDALANAKKN